MYSNWREITFPEGLETFQKNKKLDQLAAKARSTDSKKCGNCAFWMKSHDCPREHNFKGQSRGPSASESGCDKFKVDSFTAALKVKRWEDAHAYAVLHGLKERE